MRRILATLFLGLAAGAASACDVPLSLVVSGSVFERSQPVQVTVVNYCSKPVRFYASLQAEGGGDWSEWPWHLNGKPSNYGNPIYTLGANRSKALTFDIRDITFPPIPPGAKAKETDSLNFRFRVTAIDKTGPGTRTEAASSPFTIVDPFDELSGH
jgi:hypothetical protein